LIRKNFEAEVLQHQGIVVVDFWSQKCEPCKAIMPEGGRISLPNMKARRSFVSSIPVATED